MLIVSFVDDNFGDNLIRITFRGLLEVVLGNYGLSVDDYDIASMPLKRVDEELLRGADAIFFAGGGLFGLSYLDFYKYVDQITALADRHDIPVVFSSMGLNNMSDQGGKGKSIADIVNRRSVKALAVRENLRLFQDLDLHLPSEVRQVADPAVWTKFVYGMTDVVPNGTLGINVVRGGLFVANQRDWGLTAEMKYLAGIREYAESAGVAAQFYTNGSLDDNNTLRFFAQEYRVPEDQVLLPQTTREVINAIASRSAVAAIRMHSAIIAYSFGIPTVALEWNDKVPHFYDAIGHPERVIPFGEWSPDRSLDALRRADADAQSSADYESYLMSTYLYLYEAVGDHVLAERPGTERAYDFVTVADALVKRSPVVDEDEADLRVKIGKAERAYLKRFITIRENKKEARAREERIRLLSQEAEARSRAADALTQDAQALKTQLDAREQEVAELTREVDALTRTAEAHSEEIATLTERIEAFVRETDALHVHVRDQRRELERRPAARLRRAVFRARRVLAGRRSSSTGDSRSED